MASCLRGRSSSKELVPFRSSSRCSRSGRRRSPTTRTNTNNPRHVQLEIHPMRLTVVLASFALLLPVPTLAQRSDHDDHAPRPGAQASSESNKGQPTAKPGEAHGNDEGPDTENMFGFTKGTDVLEPGHYELATEAGGALGKRIGRYRVGSFTSTFQFAPFERMAIELGATGNRFSIRNVPGLDNRNTSGFGGLSAEIKYQLLKRGPSPFGLLFVAEPGVGFLEEGTGTRGRSYGVDTRIALDTELIPNTLFGGLNVIYEAERFRPRGFTLFNGEGEELELPLAPCGNIGGGIPAEVNPDNHSHIDNGGEDRAHTAAAADGENHSAVGPARAEGGGRENCAAFARRKSAERSSKFGFSGGLALQAFSNVFLGAEVRYLRAYEGLALQHFRGEAVFVGPTLYAKLNDQLSIAATWSFQVAGHAVGVPGRLDLDNFSHHEAVLRIKYEF